MSAPGSQKMTRAAPTRTDEGHSHMEDTPAYAVLSEKGVRRPLRPQSVRPGGGARDAGDHRSLRELQKELESLKRSLSVYLGPGLQSRTPLKSN